nr:cation diffusion facilitator family transporter [Syntrophomonas palmitatica]
MDLNNKAAWFSVLSNVLLTLLKLIIGLVIGSVSVISEAIHSGVDLLASIIALFAVKSSSKPPDHRHPYGHGKIENVSGTVEALLIFLAAVMIIKEAVDKIRHGSEMMDLSWGIAVMGFSALVNLIVAVYELRIGRKMIRLPWKLTGCTT